MSTPFENFLKTAGLSQRPSIARRDDILLEIIKKSEEIFRQNININNVVPFSKDVISNLRYILLHAQPHMDEYLSSLFLRSCLPENLNLEIMETSIRSRDNDEEAKELWKNAAVLGVGGTINGGATPLLLFDEHTDSSESKTEEASLVMLMKRKLIGTNRPSDPLYKILKEVHNIDVYGNGHSKNLASYVKYLNSIPLPSAGYKFMDTKWKTAIVDSVISSLLLELSNSTSRFKERFSWEPALLKVFDYVATYSPLASEDGFDAAKSKIMDYSTGKFIYAYKKTNFEMHDNLGNTIGTQNCLIPFIPALLKKYWGEDIVIMLMYPFIETRIYKDMMSEEMYQSICDTLTGTNGVFKIPTGELAASDINGITIFDFTQTAPYAIPGSLNHYVNANLKGLGISIFRNLDGTMIITKGEGISSPLWQSICDSIVKEEGESDNLINPGAWHITRSPNGIAGFILNGNPTHQYIEKSKLTINSLKSIIEKLL